MNELRKENDSENVGPNGESAEEYGERFGGWDAMAEIFTSKNALPALEKLFALIDRSIDKIANAINNNKKEDNSKYIEFEKNRRIFLWQRFILSILVIVFLYMATKNQWLKSETIVALLTAVVASLFVTPKKD